MLPLTPAATPERVAVSDIVAQGFAHTLWESAVVRDAKLMTERGSQGLVATTPELLEYDAYQK